MRILAFDQATKVTGWALLQDRVPLTYGHINEADVDPPSERIKDMFLQIVGKIETYNPDLVVVEGVQHQANAKTMLMLSQLQGMCIGVAYHKDLAVYSPLPVEWRKILNYKQGAHMKRAQLKQQSIDYVRTHFGIVATEDECEAICIGVAASKKYESEIVHERYLG